MTGREVIAELDANRIIISNLVREKLENSTANFSLNDVYDIYFEYRNGSNALFLRHS